MKPNSLLHPIKTDLKVGSSFLSIYEFEDIVRYSDLSLLNTQYDRIANNYQSFLNHHAERGVYGFNTGFGSDANSHLNPLEQNSLQIGLAHYLDCAQGDLLSYTESRAAFLARIQVLAKGFSAVDPELIKLCIHLYNAGIAPIIPSRGSLGASGDLVTLAPFARLILGESVEHWDGGKLVTEPSSPLNRLKLKPVVPQSREVLACVNGLSVAASLMALEAIKTRRLFHWSLYSAAAAHIAIGGLKSAFSKVVNAAPTRQFSGQNEVARVLSKFLESTDAAPRSEHRSVQDEYSFRCLPQVLGPVSEVLEQSLQWIEDELNSVSDNPIFDENGKPHSGGNFFGGYLSWAADNLTQSAAKIADTIERQTFILTDGQHDLPKNLVGHTSASEFRHALKGVHQISSSLCMEIQQNAIPSKLFTRSSESHNQDIVSNAMNAALRVQTQNRLLAGQVAAHSLIAVQALEISQAKLNDSPITIFQNKVRGHSSGVIEDRPLRNELKRLSEDMLENDLPLL